MIIYLPYFFDLPLFCITLILSYRAIFLSQTLSHYLVQAPGGAMVTHLPPISEIKVHIQA